MGKESGEREPGRDGVRYFPLLGIYVYAVLPKCMVFELFWFEIGSLHASYFYKVASSMLRLLTQSTEDLFLCKPA